MTEIDDIIRTVVTNRAIKGVTFYGRQWSPIIHWVSLATIMLMAFCIRLFAVIR